MFQPIWVKWEFIPQKQSKHMVFLIRVNSRTLLLEVFLGVRKCFERIFRDFLVN